MTLRHYLPQKIADLISKSNKTIYDGLADAPDLYFSTNGLQDILQNKLVGLSLVGQPLRTRSKIVKMKICEALGYQTPSSFSKIRPRFYGQNFDVYIQKANNLQIWNEEISPDRRYVLIRVDDNLKIVAVKVVTGSVIANLDTTGTLTQKYQASARQTVKSCSLISATDTKHLQRIIKANLIVLQSNIKNFTEQFIPINKLYALLLPLVGSRIANPGIDQERNRGAVLHELVQRTLDIKAHKDTGQFPDVPEQLLEIKLQTSPTIDLGLVRPDSTEHIERIPQVRHCDVRYAVFYATPEGKMLRIDYLIVGTGQDFFGFFRKFEGKEINRKLQIRLPDNFWG